MMVDFLEHRVIVMMVDFLEHRVIVMMVMMVVDFLKL